MARFFLAFFRALSFGLNFCFDRSFPLIDVSYHCIFYSINLTKQELCN